MAVEAAMVFGGFDFGLSQGALASRGSSRTWSCISHVNCPMKVKLQNLGAGDGEGFHLFSSQGVHAPEKKPLPNNFKGISAEFLNKVDEGVIKGHKPVRIESEITVACGTDERKKARMPTRAKISARRAALMRSSRLTFETYADMMDFVHDKMVQTSEEFDAVQDHDMMLVYNTFCYDIQVKDESEGAAEDAKVAAVTFGFNFGSKRTALQFKQV